MTGPTPVERSAIAAAADTRRWQSLAALLVVAAAIRVLAMQAPPISGNTAALLDRAMALLCDLAIGATVFVLVERAWPRRAGDLRPRSRAAAIAAAAWLFSPGVILLSAAWGRIDSVYTLFVLLAVVLLVSRPTLSLLSLVLAVLIAPRAIVLVPLLLAAAFLRHPWRRCLVTLAAALVLWCLVVMVLFGFNLAHGSTALIGGAYRPYPYTALNALSLWGIGGSGKSDLSPALAGLAPAVLGLLLFAAGSSYGAAALRGQFHRRADPLFLVVLGGTFAALLPAVVLTRQHEDSLFPALPLLLILSALCLRPRTTGADDVASYRFAAVPAIYYAALTLLFYMNVYRVYVELIYRPRPVPDSELLYYSIANATPVWAVLTVLGFWGLVMLVPFWLPSSSPRLAAGPDGVAPSARTL